MKSIEYLRRFSKTKIIATVGPASSGLEVITQMIKGGMRVARINLSHGTHKAHEKVIKIIRRQASLLNLPVAVLADLPGPKIRIGGLIGGSINIKAGGMYRMRCGAFQEGGNEIPVNFPLRFNDIEPGSELFMADGLVRFEVRKIGAGGITVEAVSDGIVSSGSGLSLPGLELSSKLVAGRDMKHIKFAVGQGVDFIGVSFVSSAKDIKEMRKYVKDKVWIIAKIERRKALLNLEEIIDEADGVMVARGDLGVEMPFEEVPFIQNRIIRLADNRAKPVIIATQMMESMIANPMPTRAEVSDIAGAVLEGADAVMLSGETAIGKYPSSAIRILSKVLKRAEKERVTFEHIDIKTTSDAVSISTYRLAKDLNTPLIVVPTRTGATARRLSRFNPRALILALVTSEKKRRSLLLNYGIESMLISEKVDSIEKVFQETVKIIRMTGLVKQGQPYVLVGGSVGSCAGDTDTVHVINYR